MPIPEHHYMKGDKDVKTKMGRYHGSMFWDIPGYASKKWVVGARILVEDSVPADTTNEDLVEGCIEYINQPPPRKKYQKKKPQPRFGELELYSAKVKREEDKIFITALLVTNDRRNKNFWGKGTLG